VSEEVVRELLAALNGRELDAALACMTEDVDWAGWPVRVRGRDAMRAYLTGVWAAIDPREEPLTIETHDDDSVSADVHLTVRRPDGGLAVDRRDGYTFVLRDGLVARMDAKPSGPPPIMFLGPVMPSARTTSDPDRRGDSTVRVGNAATGEDGPGKPRVYWKWEVEEDDSEASGPVSVSHADGTTEEWREWVRRSAAQAYAAEHGFDFVADE
jgi:ketosteroid isomerase-like protein